MNPIQESNFTETVNAHDRLLLWFYTDWCGYCKAMRTELEAFDALPVFCCDAELCGLLTAKFAVDAVPCLVMLEKGKAVRKAVGDMKQAEIREFFLQ